MTVHPFHANHKCLSFRLRFPLGFVKYGKTYQRAEYLQASKHITCSEVRWLRMPEMVGTNPTAVHPDRDFLASQTGKICNREARPPLQRRRNEPAQVQNVGFCIYIFKNIAMNEHYNDRKDCRFIQVPKVNFFWGGNYSNLLLSHVVFLKQVK